MPTSCTCRHVSASEFYLLYLVLLTRCCRASTVYCWLLCYCVITNFDSHTTSMVIYYRRQLVLSAALGSLPNCSCFGVSHQLLASILISSHQLVNIRKSSHQFANIQISTGSHHLSNIRISSHQLANIQISAGSHHFSNIRIYSHQLANIQISTGSHQLANIQISSH